MGKRKKRLHSPKYAKKYASVRTTIARLQGVVEEAEADGVITPQEAEEIKEAKQEVVDAVVETVAEEVKETVKKVVKAVKSKKKATSRKRASKKEASPKG